jgi:folate-dependent phosphoribosylglycinamide formyltransferase PurN
MRIAVLAPRRLNDYYVRVLAHLFEDERTQVVGAVIDARPPKPMGEKLRRELKRGRGGYVAVMAAQALARRGGDDGGADTAEHFAAHDAPTLDVGDLYADQTVDWLRDLRPDALLRVGFGIIREPILSLAPYGVLSYHHGDMRRYRGQPPAFWEIYNGEREIGVTLQVLNDGLDAGQVVCERRFEVRPGESLETVRKRIYGDTDSMARDACLRLGDPAFDPVSIPEGELGDLYTLPNLRQWLAMRARVARRRTAQ